MRDKKGVYFMNEKYEENLYELNDEAEILDEELEEDNPESLAEVHLKLDAALQTSEERTALVEKIIAQTPPEKLTPAYLETLANYILYIKDKEERKKRKILTNERMVTINRNETSFEGLCAGFENGEDGIYNILSDLGKNTILHPKDPITAEDVAKSKALQELITAIEKTKEMYKTATGKRKFLLKKQIIEMQQDQYVIRNEGRCKWLGGGRANHMAKSMSKLNFYDSITFDENDEPVNNGLISFFNPSHIEALLCNYSDLKETAYGQLKDDLYYLMEDLDELAERALKDYPLYQEIVLYKIDGKLNIEIQELLEQHFGIKHSVEYISSLWRNKIPKMIAEQAKEDYIMWYYTTQERGKWKKCSRCGEIKLAHNRFFSKNKTSKDGYYSICKCCRNAKNK